MRMRVEALLESTSLIVEALAEVYSDDEVRRFVSSDEVLFELIRYLFSKSEHFNDDVSQSLCDVSLKLREVREEVAVSLTNSSKLLFHVVDSVEVVEDGFQNADEIFDVDEIDR